MKLLPLAADIIDFGATFSDCGRYRYTLWRSWGSREMVKPAVAFIGLNPSTAVADKDEPTLQSCQRIARHWGFGRMTMLNLFAWRSTDPRGLIGLPDPVGPENNERMATVIGLSTRVVMAWGQFHELGRMLDERVFHVRRLLRGHTDLGTMGLNADGSPKHPLYLKGTTPFAQTVML